MTRLNDRYIYNKSTADMLVRIFGSFLLISPGHRKARHESCLLLVPLKVIPGIIVGIACSMYDGYDVKL